MIKWEECNIIMLPRKKSNIFLNIDSNKLGYMPNESEESQSGKYDKLKNRHLYITSDEKPGKGDWCLIDHNVGESTGFEILQCLNADIINGEYTFKDDDGDLYTTGRCEKIIVTTDNLPIEKLTNKRFSIGLEDTIVPQIHPLSIELFIAGYNKGNKIEKVKVEHEEIDDNDFDNNEEGGTYPGIVTTKSILKINSDNTVNIKLIDG